MTRPIPASKTLKRTAKTRSSAAAYVGIVPTAGVQPTSSRDRGMLSIGLDVSSMDRPRLAAKREKRGECVSCGARLFKVSVFGKKRTPLNTKGEVENGRCLLCFPLEIVDDCDAVCHGEVPRELHEDDNSTILSSITMEPDLVEIVGPGAGAEQDETQPEDASEQAGEFNYGKDAGSPYRSDAGSNVADERPELRRQAQRKGSIAWVPPPIPEEAEETKMEITPLPVDPIAFSVHGSMVRDANENSQEMEIFFDSLVVDNDPMALPFNQHDEIGVSTSTTETVTLNEAAHHMEATRDSCGLPLSSASSEHERLDSAMDELVMYIKRLDVDSTLIDHEACIGALENLSAIIWAHGNQAKRHFADQNGMPALSKVVWADIGDEGIQEAALGLFLALAVSRDGQSKNDVIQDKGAEGCIDALLISMQTHRRNDVIQETGCRILCCLASASSHNTRVNDGSQSGAVITVLDSMQAHPQSVSVQEWALRALYSQCVLSEHAEGNKRTLVSGVLENGEKGPAILMRSLCEVACCPPLTEVACDLYWCLTASEDVAAKLVPANVLLKVLTSISRAYRKRRDLAPILEAAVGSIANLAKMTTIDEEYADELSMLVVDIIRRQKSCPSVVVEACCLTANVVGSIDHALKVTESVDTVRVIVESTMNHASSFPGKESLYEEGLRALLALAEHSKSVKTTLLDRANFSALNRLWRDNETATELMTLVCRLFASICQVDTSIATKNIVMNTTCRIMSLHGKSEALQEAACETLRVVASDIDCQGSCDYSMAISLTVEAMKNHRSEGLLVHACHLLWSTVSSSSLSTEVEMHCLQMLVNALKDQVQAVTIVDPACSALWKLLHGSEHRKRMFVAVDGAIDAISCVLAMHTNKAAVPVLAKAMGVLASVSASEKCANEVISFQLLDTVLDAMRNNRTSALLLQSAMVFLRNSITAVPELASEADNAINVVINTMIANRDNEIFQKEACSLLWVMSAVSNESKSKILALDGVSVLIETLDNFSEKDVQEAALGAFNELALTPSMPQLAQDTLTRPRIHKH